MAHISRLLVLVAVLLMPFGMGHAVAVAPHHAPIAGVPMGHCPDPAPGHDNAKGGIADCTMACAAALPAFAIADEEPLPIASEPAPVGVVQMLLGLHPETATPPPKLS